MTQGGFDLKRYLDAKFPGHVRTDSELRRQWAAKTAATAFPELDRDLEFVFIRSRRRHCAKFEVAGRGGIIMDDGMSDLLGVGDLLLLDGPYVDDAGLAFAAAQYAEAFHVEADAERTIVAAAQANRRPLVLELLCERGRGTPGRSAAMLFLLLHEVAHFAVDNGVPFVTPRMDDVRRMLSSLVEQNENFAFRLESGESLAELDASLGPDPSPERDMMLGQILSYIGLIRDDPELIREASCDFVALVGLAELRVASGAVEGQKKVSRLNYREFGDALFIALRATRLMVAQEMIRRMAEHVVAGSDPSELAKPFARLTARSKIVTNLASEYFNDVVGGFDLDMPHRSDDPGKPEDPRSHFRDGVDLFQSRSVERLFDPVEQLNRFFGDPVLYSRVASEFMVKQFGSGKPPLEELEPFADGLIASAPF